MTTVSGSSTATGTSSIANTLGVGSGIDVASLVTNLVAAQKAPAEAIITNRQSANKAKVSALADLSSGIDSFASALKALIDGGSLFTQPASSDSGAVGATAIAGGRIGGLSSTLQVNALAQGQTLVSAAVSDPAAAIGQGGMTLTNARGSFPITIDASDDSLAGLARAINGTDAGVTASVLTDATGSRLVLKGVVGASAAFTLTANTGAAPGLAAYAYDGTATTGLSKVQSAQDASLVLDGVTVRRSSNTVSDLIPGVKLSLKAVTTSAISLTASVPTDAISTAVGNFVDTYNQLMTTLRADAQPGLNGAAAGAFSGDPTIRAMITQLGALNSSPLVSSGAVRTLADLGVSTGNDGKLTVDSTRLGAVLASHPDDVEALFNPTQTSSSPLVQITSAMGSAAPGSYTLTDLVKGPPPSGKINGQAMIVAGTHLVAPVKSGAGGLVVALTGDVASATVMVEAGLGGALQSIRDGLRAGTGPLQTLSDALTKQADQISDDSDKLDARMDAYQAQLQTSFTAMNTRVTALKATQSYLEQQIKVWTNDTSS